jgi:transcriptional regulator with XRE-family HTH domain
VRYPDERALGDAVRELRTELGFSQEGFAHAVGLHRTYIGGIERGERNPSFRNLVRIASALDVRLSELFTRAERRAR